VLRTCFFRFVKNTCLCLFLFMPALLSHASTPRQQLLHRSVLELEVIQL